jgi:carbamoyltransferase
MTVENKPWVLGISCSHNGAVCLLRGSEIVAAVQEERLTRVKRQKLHGALPSLAINYCLQHAGIKASDLSLIACTVQGRTADTLEDVALNPLLQAVLHKVPIVTLSHHLAHAVSAFAISGFDDSAILVIDGVGSPEEDFSAAEKNAIKSPIPNGSEAISLYSAQGTSFTPLEKHLVAKGRWVTWEFLRMPRFQSLGGIFSAAAWQIFGDHLEAGKVMGLAPYGEPDFPASDFFEIVDGRFEYKDTVPARFDHADRWPKRQSEYKNLACSTQAALEEALMFLTGHLRELFPSRNLCYAGGVALNSVANERIIRESGFEDVYIIPAAEDSGCAIGAAYHGLWQLTGENTRQRLKHDAVGRSYSREEIAETIARVPGIEVAEPADPLAEVVDLLCSGKIVGWFQGRSELGPRALGQRSILCDPRSPDAKAVLNSRVKHREEFRPFAPVIPLEEAASWFEADGHDLASPFMLRVCRIKEDKQPLIPGVVHVDGTGRIQTVTREENGLFYELIKKFHAKTGVPVLINTSYNVMDEPIVETPDDAVWCFLSTGIDACVLEGRIVTKKPGFRSILDFYPYLDCLRLAETRLVDEGRIGSGEENESFVTFNVKTPWGRARQIASSNVLPVLSLLDGRTDGWSLIEKLAGRQAKQPDQQTLVRSLARWRKASPGEFLIDGTATATDVLQVLHRQQISAYDEPALTRMLVRLRRQGVIGFRAAPIGPVGPEA